MTHEDEKKTSEGNGEKAGVNLESMQTTQPQPTAEAVAPENLEQQIADTLRPSRRKHPRRKWIWLGLALLAAVAAGALLRDPLLGAAGRSSSPQIQPQAPDEPSQKYTCGMHPQIVQDEPGFCPICSMKLTPVQPKKQVKKKIVTGEAACKDRSILYYQAPMDPTYHSPAAGKSPMGMDLVPACESDEAASTDGIQIDPRIRQNMGIRTALVTEGPLVKHIRTVGHVDYDERRFSIINTKIDGWVEKLNVDFTGQRVRRGQALLSIFSPKLISTQEELLLATRQFKLTGARRDRVMLEAAERRLAYWDISQSQIEQIESSGQVTRHLAVHAPMTGVVVHKNVFVGMHVTSGMDLFKIADLSRVWVYAHLYEMDVPFVKVGQRVTVQLPYDPGHSIEGRVDFVFPWLDAKTRDVKARLVFDNRDRQLKPEMFVDVNIAADLGQRATLVDSSAILRSGERNIAFVQTEPGLYSPRRLALGRDLGDTIEVLDGLEPGERVVINGQFMLDSESRLTEALQKFEKATPSDEKADEPTQVAPAQLAPEPKTPAHAHH